MTTPYPGLTPPPPPRVRIEKGYLVRPLPYVAKPKTMVTFVSALLGVISLYIAAAVSIGPHHGIAEIVMAAVFVLTGVLVFLTLYHQREQVDYIKRLEAYTHSVEISHPGYKQP